MDPVEAPGTNEIHALRRARLEQGWSEAELADLAGVTQAHLSYIENRQRNPGPRVQVALSRALGMRVRDLFPVDEIDGL
jgi:transcriptional regulator with XRE-family HTH domain